MTKRTVGRAVFAALVVAAPAAGAQEGAPFPDRSHVAIVLDNLGGYVNTNESYSNANAPTNDHGSNNFGWFPLTPVARFGIHGFLGGGLTLGGGLIYAYEKLGLSPLATDLGGSTTFGISPRVGYAVAIGPTTALWLRGGFTYTTSSDDNDNGGTWQFSPGGEVYFVYAPVPHFGITIGPFAEFAVAGKQTSCTTALPGGGVGAATSSCTDTDVRTRYIGLTFGVLADF
jgi:hypothetical protein